MANENMQITATLDIGRSTSQINSGLAELSRRIKTLELGVHLNTAQFSKAIDSAVKGMESISKSFAATAASIQAATASLKQAVSASSNTKSPSNVGWPKTKGDNKYAYPSKAAA